MVRKRRMTKREVKNERDIYKMAYRYGKSHGFEALTKKGRKFVGLKY